MSEKTNNVKSSIQLEEITPAIAQEILDRNGPNRNVGQKYVERLKRDLYRDKWDPDASIIKIDTDGQLQDGQHRLTAIVQSGKTVQCWVHRNVKPETRSFVDIGHSRSAADLLTTRGVKSANAVLSAAKGWLAFEANRFQGPTPDKSPEELDAYIGDAAEYWGTMYVRVLKMTKMLGDGSAMALCGAMEYVRRCAPDKEKVEQWESMLVDGYNIEPGSAAEVTAHAIRTRVGEKHGNFTAEAKKRSAYFYIKGFDNFQRGIRVKSIQYRKDSTIPDITRPIRP